MLYDSTLDLRYYFDELDSAVKSENWTPALTRLRRFSAAYPQRFLPTHQPESVSAVLDSLVVAIREYLFLTTLYDKKLTEVNKARPAQAPSTSQMSSIFDPASPQSVAALLLERHGYMANTGYRWPFWLYSLRVRIDVPIPFKEWALWVLLHRVPHSVRFDRLITTANSWTSSAILTVPAECVLYDVHDVLSEHAPGSFHTPSSGLQSLAFAWSSHTEFVHQDAARKGWMPPK